MKKHLYSVMVLFTLLLVLCLHAFAAENTPTASMNIPNNEMLCSTYKGQTTKEKPFLSLLSHDLNTSESSAPDIVLNDVSIALQTAKATVNGTTYLAATPILSALYPDATLMFQGGTLTATASNLHLEATIGSFYFMVNGRYIYIPETAIEQDGVLLLPAKDLTNALGCSFVESDQTGDITMRKIGAVTLPIPHSENDLYWLSRAIYSESGNQPIAGRIAVGTVILNRVADPKFPNTIEGVIFAPGQFSPVANGTIYREPDAMSVLAAKLCLDGAREAGNSLYFNVTSMHSWADSSRAYVCTIGGHNFYL